ncbi:t-SNARE, partial [Aureobasidium melanogenum]
MRAPSKHRFAQSRPEPGPGRRHPAGQAPFLPQLSPHSADQTTTTAEAHSDNHVLPRLAQSRRQDKALPISQPPACSNTLTAQPTTWRRSDDPEYQDDPEFNSFTTDLSDRLFSLTANISRLSSQVALLGTKRETDRVRERVQDLLEETSASFKDIGDGLKKVQAWHDLGPAQKYTQGKLNQEFKASLTEFQTLQRTALEKQRASATAARTALEESGSPTVERSQQQLQ